MTEKIHYSYLDGLRSQIICCMTDSALSFSNNKCIENQKPTELLQDLPEKDETANYGLTTNETANGKKVHPNFAVTAKMSALIHQ